jgi:hypothetical protein
MKNILCVGFGGIGCRHTQSLLNVSPELNIYVVEPNEAIFKENEVRIGAKSGRLKHVTSIDAIDVQIDFAIIATSASPRFEIMKELLNKGILNFLVEKVVFQSAAQFEEIISLLEKNNGQAYCNFVSRYFSNYQDIKSRVKDNSIVNMIVSGGDFGLGCNSLHYVDLFEYFTGKTSKLISSSLVKNDVEHKRGVLYKEVTGQLAWSTASGDTLSVLSDKNQEGGVEVTIAFGGEVNVINQQTRKHFQSIDGNIENKVFELKYTSSLTKTIYEDIIDKSTVLPTIQLTENCHVQLFKAINHTLGLKPTDICPIT